MVTVIDNATADKLRTRIDKLRRLGIMVETGPLAELRGPTSADLAVISPGIDPATPLVQHFLRQRIEMIGEIELAFELCHCPVIAITGTNGKTTTTELVEKMLLGAGLRTMAGGNIGLPFTEAVRRTPALDCITLEVSSFQLEAIRKFRPKVAAWLNFSPDHLDRYTSLEEYRAAKMRIFENQTKDDWAVLNAADCIKGLKARTILFSAAGLDADFTLEGTAILYHGTPVLDLSQTHLRGLHNAENLMAALGIGLAMGIPFENLTPALCDYQPLPHRCESIRVLEGVEYINDSKATNLDALEKALQSETRPLVLIAGGKDKGFPFDSLTLLVKEKVASVVLIGEMAERIRQDWGEMNCHLAKTLPDAVELARTLAVPGGAVLFSPGTSSFDMFKSYADRGDQFRAIVQALHSQP